MPHYYIYYRIQTNLIPAIETAIQLIQSEIQTQLGVTGRLLKKRDEPELWMEIYEKVPDASAFEAVLREAETKSGIASLLDPASKRHLECFLD